MNDTEWNGYPRLDFLFEDRRAILVFPKKKGCGHHPHGLENNEKLRAFIRAHLDPL